MKILVTGARGVLGRRVVSELERRGHDVRTAGRSAADVPMDLETGAGIETAAAGVDAAIHCATDARRHRQVDAAGTVRLLRHLDAPIAYPSIVGCDVIPLPYYGSKLAAEEAIARHAHDHFIVRATQFHQLVWAVLARLARPPLMLVPNDTRVQPLDPGTLAVRLVDAVDGGERGRADDLGGRFAYDAKDLARSYLAAVGSHRPVARVNVPGLTGAAFRAGGNLTPNRDEVGESWNDFVARRTTRSTGP